MFKVTSDSLLKSYYKHALVVAYPSLYEGLVCH